MFKICLPKEIWILTFKNRLLKYINQHHQNSERVLLSKHRTRVQPPRIHPLSKIALIKTKWDLSHKIIPKEVFPREKRSKQNMRSLDWIQLLMNGEEDPLRYSCQIQRLTTQRFTFKHFLIKEMPLSKRWFISWLSPQKCHTDLIRKTTRTNRHLLEKEIQTRQIPL